MSDNKVVKTVVNGAIWGSLFGAAFFAVERLLKIADDQNKMIKKMLSQLEDLEEELKDCEEKLSQCEKVLST